MIPQHHIRRTDAQLMRRPALQLCRNRLDARKKRFYEAIEFFTGRRQSERTPMKKRRSEEFLKLGNLATDGRLLNAVRDVPHCFADAPMSRHVIKKLQMMNIHILIQPLNIFTSSPASNKNRRQQFEARTISP